MLEASDICWKVVGQAIALNRYLSDRHPEWQEAEKQAARLLLVAFINDGCSGRGGANINQIGTHGDWKLVKMRLALPGQGRSGSLRLSIGLHCARAEVRIFKSAQRRDDPDLAEMIADAEVALDG
jgi:hypothetical protein